MSDMLETLKSRLDALTEEIQSVFGRLNPIADSGENVLSTRVEHIKERIEDESAEAGSVVLSRLNQHLVKYGVILKDDLEKIEERIDRLEAAIREL